MLEASIMMFLISILGFTVGEIRFQVFRNNPVIPTICRAARGQDDAAVIAGLMATIGPLSGKSQSDPAADVDADGDPAVVVATRRGRWVRGCADGLHFAARRNFIFAR
jgi:hypothetical protein